jgi:hypothetical protein
MKYYKVLNIIFSFVLFSSLLSASEKDNKKGYESIMMCSLAQERLVDHTFGAIEITYMHPEGKENEVDKILANYLLAQKKLKLTKKQHKMVSRLSVEWKKTEKKLTKVTKENVSKLYKDVVSFDELCLSFADTLVDKKASSPKIKVAKINFYAQKITSLYIIKAWGAIDSETYKNDANKLLISYKKLYSELIGDKHLSKDANKSLKDIDKAFTTFKFMTKSTSGRYMPVLAHKKATQINMLTTTILEGK